MPNEKGRAPEAPDPAARKHIIVFGQHTDPHVDRVIRHWKDIENSKVTLIDQWRLTTCTIEFIDEKFFIRVNGEAIALNELTMIWWRIKPYFGDHPIEFVDALQARYWRQQWEAMQRSLEVLASRCYVLNPLNARQYATLKPVQLSVAKQVGLKFPNTVFGNDFRRVLSLGDDIFFKHFKSSNIKNEHPSHTCRYTQAQIEQNSDLLKSCPGIFQKYIEKDHELRVCVFGNKVYAFRLESQKYNSTKEDWRRMRLPKNAISIVNLELYESEKLIEFNRKMSLDYSIMDLIRTPDGELIFLEANPDGQWGWLERATGANLSKAFSNMAVNCLTPPLDQ